MAGDLLHILRDVGDGQRVGRPADVDDAPTGIDQRVQMQVAFLGIADRLLQVGDVAEHAEHLDHLAVGVVAALAVGQHVADAAVRAHDAQLEPERPAFVHRHVDAVAHIVAVVGMIGGDGRLHVRLAHLRRPAVNAVDLVGPIQRVGRHMDVPVAHATQPLDDLEALEAGQQLAHGQRLGPLAGLEAGHIQGGVRPLDRAHLHGAPDRLALTGPERHHMGQRALPAPGFQTRRPVLLVRPRHVAGQESIQNTADELIDTAPQQGAQRFGGVGDHPRPLHAEDERVEQVAMIFFQAGHGLRSSWSEQGTHGPISSASNTPIVPLRFILEVNR